METAQTKSGAQKKIPFRVVLQNEFSNRCRNSPRYSLRDYARFLNINHSSLSRIIRGDRQISEKLKLKLGLRLGISPAKLQEFETKSKSTSGPILQVANYNQLALDNFALISDWYHYAILEATYLRSFKLEPKWISKALGISTSEAALAIERLKRLGFLKQNLAARWENVSGANTNITESLGANSPLKAEAKIKLQKQVLQMAATALDEIPVDRRSQSSMTMAINSKRWPEAEKMITKFRRKLTAFLEQDSERDQVYQLGISMYPLTPSTIKE